MPQSPMLLPGIGAQGATPADVARAFTSGPASALVTASRSVIFAFRDTDEDWRVAAANEAEQLRVRSGPLRVGDVVVDVESPPGEAQGTARRRRRRPCRARLACAGCERADDGPPSRRRRLVPRRRGRGRARAAQTRRPRAIASITKLMTTIVALEHARPSDVVRVPGRGAAIGGSTIFLRAASSSRSPTSSRRRWSRARTTPPTALALHVGGGSSARFVALMNAKAGELGLADTHFANPHGLDEPATSRARGTRRCSSATRSGSRSSAMRSPGRRRTLPGGRDFPTTDDLLASWPPLLGGKTGHTAAAGWSRGRAARARGATVYGAVLGGDSPRRAQRGARTLLSLRARAATGAIAAIDSSRVYATAETGYGSPPSTSSRRARSSRTVRESTPLSSGSSRPASSGSPCAGGSGSAGSRSTTATASSPPRTLVAADDVSGAGPARQVGRGSHERTARTSGGSSRDRHRHRQRRARPHAHRARPPDRPPAPLERGRSRSQVAKASTWRGRSSGSTSRSSRPGSPAAAPARASWRS